jgi:ABC-type polysaccharide/polyol phosphate transport system ATPase subunit
VSTAIQSKSALATMEPERENAICSSNRAGCVLSFQGVSKSYLRNADRGLLRHRLVSLLQGSPRETFQVLDNISFEINENQSLAVVGPNGAGKSTLLRLATGIATPDRGEIEVRGKIASLMELGAGFHPDLTGAENLVLNASLLGLSRKETYEKFDSIVEFSGVAEFIRQPLRTYSSGMMLRLAFAVAVHTTPDVMFVDELLAVGDQNFRQKCIHEIKRLKLAGMVLVCVSHDINLARELCELALWLEHRRVEMFGPADQVLDRYERSVISDGA